MARWPNAATKHHSDAASSTQLSAAQLSALKATDVPKVVVAGVDDPQMSHSDAALTAKKIGAPLPVYVPGRHLTMIASPGQVAAAIDSLANSR